ncbi:MAG: S8/S53 family peptidase [Pseudomonadota bacterium]
MARTIIRGRIPDTEEVRKLLESRTPDTRFEIAELLRKEFAEPARITPDAEPLELLKYARSWGYLAPDQDPREVRQTLVDSYSLFTEYFPAEPRVEPAGSRDPRRRRPQELQQRYEQSPPADQPERQSEEINLDTDVFAPAEELPRDYKGFVGVDTEITPIAYTDAATHWSSGKFGSPTFGSAGDAMALVGVQSSRHAMEEICASRDGKDVNVVIADVGINEDFLRETNPGVDYAGGFISSSSLRPLPGTFNDPLQRPIEWHGNLIARNILRCAPKARIFDAPLLPPRVSAISGFTYDVDQLYLAILWERFFGPFKDQPWIVVNAWAVADSQPETQFGLPEQVLYSSGAFHPTNILLQVLGRNLGKNSLDIIFAAGNAGEFAPDTGIGLYDRGRDRSIKGSNALSGVLTVGACDFTGRWIGTSSQGDGPAALKYGVPNSAKPDLCAPAWFSDPHDPAALNTGSSTACAVAAGIVASLRTSERTKSSADLFSDLKDAAIGIMDHSPRTGAGRIVL